MESWCRCQAPVVPKLAPSVLRFGTTGSTGPTGACDLSEALCTMAKKSSFKLREDLFKQPHAGCQGAEGQGRSGCGLGDFGPDLTFQSPTISRHICGHGGRKKRRQPINNLIWRFFVETR